MPGKSTKVETAFDSPEFEAESAALATVGNTSPAVYEPEFVPMDFADAVAHFADLGEEITMFEGSPWHPVDSAVLVGKRFLIMDIRDYPESQWKYGRPWVSILGITEEPVVAKDGRMVNRVVINDGGTGIAMQMVEYLRRHPDKRRGQLCPGGLRASSYPIDKDGNPLGPNDPGRAGEATTYYIA